MTDQRDYWTDPVKKDYLKDNRGHQVEETIFMTFVHYGKGYWVAKNLQTYCIGVVGGPQNNILSQQLAPDVVTKPLTSSELSIGENEEGIVTPKKNLGGRPRKPLGAKVSRQTEWRRKKELQGVLL